MKLVVEIPKEFENDFDKVNFLTLADTRFEDSLNRIKADLKNNSTLSGNYELEIIDMLIKTFKNAKTQKNDGWNVVKDICKFCKDQRLNQEDICASNEQGFNDGIDFVAKFVNKKLEQARIKKE